MKHTDSLWDLTGGERGRITGFDGTLDEKYRVRLMELGFHPGEVVSCLQSPAFTSPKVYRVANTVFALDDGVASHIIIDRVADS
ncbi:MAG: ferrous iron transport protein A [Candidatus Eisenbacteria bacterium]|uniref:Ferrous iron transport protein A n=1 Tax=Eiseniibacteriota bacterium TaxID=2212470 RepID=A0A7Y2H0V6_UNCEI|nr:ferrous iron transport protein A [Candidatus Eisenbacteria bacterium]